MFTTKMSFDEAFTQLERELDSIYSEFRKPPKETPQRIFHYTTAEGLIGITGTRRLWASNVRFLNDPSEPKYAVTMLRQATEAVKNKNKALHRTETKQLLGSFWNMAEQQRIHGPEAYVFCLCEYGDLLSQWRGYAEQGRGYALGFDTAKLLGLLRPADGQYLIKVVYNAQQQLNEAESVIDRIASVLGELETAVGSIANKFGENARRIRQRVSSALLAEVIRLQAHFKNVAFAEEKEWRVVQFVHPQASLPAVRFRGLYGRILPYLELPLNQDGIEQEFQLPIDHVIFGPKLDPISNEEVLRMLFQQRGYSSIPINMSTVPFRS